MSKTKERIHDSNLRYKQGLGQNFIYDEDLLAALVASSEITKDDDVLEIGPGEQGRCGRHSGRMRQRKNHDAALPELFGEGRRRHDDL